MAPPFSNSGTARPRPIQPSSRPLLPLPDHLGILLRQILQLGAALQLLQDVFGFLARFFHALLIDLAVGSRRRNLIRMWATFTSSGTRVPDPCAGCSRTGLLQACLHLSEDLALVEKDINHLALLRNRVVARLVAGVEGFEVLRPWDAGPCGCCPATARPGVIELNLGAAFLEFLPDLRVGNGRAARDQGGKLLLEDFVLYVGLENTVRFACWSKLA